jgi:chromosome segregation ATPase
MPQQAAHVEPSRIPSEAIPKGDLLEVLTFRVESLVERHRKVRQEIEELSARLAEREKRIRELEKGMESAKRLRRDVGKRIDGLIAQVERLERAQA